MVNCSRLLAGKISVRQVKEAETRSFPPAERHLLRYSEPQAPLVVWNITRECNLACRHCYLGAMARPAEDELSGAEARAFMDDLAELGVPLLAFSGGEPLARPDVFELAAYARSRGLPTLLSTNGTLITPETARRIREAGFSYVGISIDGTEETHDRFRGKKGAFREAVEGIRNLQAEGLRVGLRITVTRLNFDDLEGVFDLALREGVPRVTVFQLVYAGRGKELLDWDIEREARRQLISWVLEKSLLLSREGREVEVVTADNYADGVYLYRYIRHAQPERAGEVRELLRLQSGCRAGERLLNVDFRGEVHPCPYWQSRSLGNVRERKLSEIWRDSSNPFLQTMRNKAFYLKGRCGRCLYRSVCGGCRVRAEMAYGDPLAEDPACYLEEAEILD